MVRTQTALLHSHSRLGNQAPIGSLVAVAGVGGHIAGSQTSGRRGGPTVLTPEDVRLFIFKIVDTFLFRQRPLYIEATR